MSQLWTLLHMLMLLLLFTQLRKTVKRHLAICQLVVYCHALLNNSTDSVFYSHAEQFTP